MTTEIDEPGVQDAYAPRAAVEAGVLDAVCQANAAFLQLVARRAGADAAGALGLASAVADRIARLDARARRVAAHCPYTLFNLRFEDAAFWRGVAREAAEERAAEREAERAGTAPPAEPPLARADDGTFALKASVLAWHLARSQDLAAALVLGMTPGVQDAWRGMPLSALDRAAASALPHLRVRWGTHGRFWSQLLDAAERPGAERAERVRLLGLQLLATDGVRPQLAKKPRRG